MDRSLRSEALAVVAGWGGDHRDLVSDMSGLLEPLPPVIIPVRFVRVN